MDETPRASDLQIQVEQVNLALRQLRHTQESLNGLETRLTEMTRDCASILERWASNDERHATAVVELHNRLSEWNDIERRLLSESTTRVHQFERSLQHEWQAIRQSHEEPLRQIEAQTSRVTDACLTAVDQALKGFERAESRLARLELDLQQEMGTLAREMREAVAHLRQDTPQLGARQPWSLDNVVRLHNELRTDGQSVAGPGRGTLALAEAVDVEPSPSAPDHGDRTPVAPAAAHEAPAASPSRRQWVAVGGLVVAMAAFGVYVQGQVQSGLRQAAARAEAAERGAAETQARAAAEIARAQQAADVRLREAQQAARMAQTLATIAASSDLRRFDLAAPRGSGAALVLWSRARGVAVTATELPVPGPGQTYQVWLLTPERATGVALLPVDADGRASVVLDPPPGLPRPVVRAMITLEPAGGSDAPTGPAVLSMPPASAATSGP